MDAAVDQNVPTKPRLCTRSSRWCCRRWLGGVSEKGGWGGGCLRRNWEGRGGEM